MTLDPHLRPAVWTTPGQIWCWRLSSRHRHLDTKMSEVPRHPLLYLVARGPHVGRGARECQPIRPLSDNILEEHRHGRLWRRVLNEQEQRDRGTPFGVLKRELLHAG